MNRKLPDDCFGIYLGMGPDRSYSKLATQLGVNKRSITSRATKERWQERLEAIERQAREQTDKKAAESIEQMNTRHLKSLTVVFVRALETLKAKALDDPNVALRALDLVFKHERAIRGDGSERTESVLLEAAKRDFATLLEPADGG